MDHDQRIIRRNCGLLMLLTFAFASGSVFLSPAMLFESTMADLGRLPRTIGFWVGTDIDPGPSARMLPNSSILSRRYTDIAGDEFVLTIVCGSDLADLHRPEYCLEGSGWETLDSRRVQARTLLGEDIRARMLHVRSPNSQEMLCLYWFAGSRDSTDTLAGRKLTVLRRALSTGEMEPTAIVRITAPLDKDFSVTEDVLLLVAGTINDQLNDLLSSQSVPHAGKQ